jgi:hypothetical protein
MLYHGLWNSLIWCMCVLGVLILINF